MKNRKKIYPLILKYYNIMQRENLEELIIENKNFSLKIKRKKRAPTQEIKSFNTNQISTKQIKNTSNSSTSTNLLTVKSPLNGIFYRAPSPTSEPFVKENDTVKKNSVICIIEAMKVMNEINAPMDCKIIKILVENGKQVTKEQPLFLIQPA